MQMKKLNELATTILANNPQPNTETLISEDTYFNEPSRGMLDYYSFADFTNEKELAAIFKSYLQEENLSDTDLQKLSALAFELHQSKKDDAGDLSEFVYVMH